MLLTWGQGARGFNPANLGNLAAWFRFNSGITDTAGAVSQWNDASGNARHLLQATATNQPAKQGDGSILFDGVDNFLKCDAFTLNQPETVYILFKQVTWTSADFVFDGNANSTMGLRQITGSPRLGLSAGGAGGPSSTDLAVDTYGAVASIFNGAASVVHIGSTTSATGDPGAANAGGFCLGSLGGGAANFANIQVKEVVVYSVAHDATTRQQVIDYLNAL